MLFRPTGLKCLQLRRTRIGGLEMPKTLGLGTFKILQDKEVKLVTDKGADRSVMINKLERILTGSGASYGETRFVLPRSRNKEGNGRNSMPKVPQLKQSSKRGVGIP
jgi:hypothetical protein